VRNLDALPARLLDFDSTPGCARETALSRPEDTRNSVDSRRRDFLIRCCQGVGAAAFPSRLSGFAFAPSLSSTGPDAFAPAVGFQLHPHYRSQRPLDSLLLKARADQDNFVTETYAEQLAAILGQWSAALLRSPQDLQAIEDVLDLNFLGSSFQPLESRLLRDGPTLEIRQNTFGPRAALDRHGFVQDLRSAVSVFSNLVTAEFQLTNIEVDSSTQSASAPAGRLKTRLRYDWVGSGKDFYREQRVGYCDLEWQGGAGGEYRLRSWKTLEETRSRSAHEVFVDITAQSFGGNSSYSAQLLPGADHWRTILDGACGIDIYGHNGVSVGDIDNDGFDDVYICQPAGLPNRLYRNRGDGTFEDITESSGLGILENTACALFVDVDNDGRQDLIVVRTNGPLLFLNQGNGKFRWQRDAFQFASPPQGTFTGAAAADYDGDGWLDVYFCLYIYYQGTDQYNYPAPYFDAQNGPPNFMMRNHHDGTFRDVTTETGLQQNNTRYSFCCAWGDFNGDGWPDLYVVNDFGRKNLYRNNRDGTFTDVAPQAGVEDLGAGMSVCWFDHDNDGLEDLYVANMWTAAGKRISTQDAFQRGVPEADRARYRKHAMGNSLLRNSGTGAFQDRSASAGVEMGRWSWSSDSWDFDHDGFPDLYITNGMVSGPSREDLNSFFWRQVVAHSPRDAKPSQNYEMGWSAINELIRADGSWSGYERNVFYANNGDGTFSDVSGAVGLDFLEDGRAFALADFDQDGRLEVLLKNRNGPQVRLLKNAIRDLAPSIAFRLCGSQGNRDAIGAAVTVETELARQTQRLEAGSGFLSQHSKELFFGLGKAQGPVRAWIRWPSGLVEELPDLPPNHRIWVEEGKRPYREQAFPGLEPAAGRPRAAAKPPDLEPLPTQIETWLLAPVAAPDFSLSDLTGKPRTLSALRGKPALLNFWIARSAACREDLDVFNRLHARWASRGLELLTVNVDTTLDAEGLRALAHELKLSFPILGGSEDTAGIYSILYRYLFDRHRDLGIPTSFLIDPQGDIVKVYQGPVKPKHVERDFQQLPRTLKERLAKALPFPGFSETAEFQRNYLSYGSVFFQRGYFEQAAASFQKALDDDPWNAEALYGLGSVYLQQQQAGQARASFERAVKLRSSYPDTLPNAWNNLGLLATREARTADAIQCFQEALRLSPDHLIALDNLGNAYRERKQWEDARKTLEHAVEVGPEDPEANYSLGMVYAQLNDSQRAYNYLERALELRPAYPEALNNLGVLYLRTQRRDAAVASFEKCIRVAPGFDQSYLNLARVYVLERAPDQARTVLLELLKQHPGHAQAQKALEQLKQ
jgi:tetratricopeptide (TPR) repeat protein/peroxiredoxin